MKEVERKFMLYNLMTSFRTKTKAASHRVTKQKDLSLSGVVKQSNSTFNFKRGKSRKNRIDKKQRVLGKEMIEVK